MIFVKNLSGWHRTARLGAAAAMGSCAWHYGLTPVGAIFAVGGVTMALTAVFAYCPMCRIDAKRRTDSK
ncbi:MAG: DUF2892 domain-containing protein [Polaromonas sp.]